MSTGFAHHLVSLPEFLISTAWNPTFSGSDITPIHRSDKARPKSNVFAEQCKFGLRHIVTRTNKFPIVAVIEVKVLRTIKVIKIFGLTTKMLADISQLNSFWDAFIPLLRSTAVEMSEMNFELMVIPERSQINYTCLYWYSFILKPSTERQQKLIKVGVCWRMKKKKTN